MQPIVHCVYGPIAAGKSTVARRLAADHRAIRFAIDEWMAALYAPDRPPIMSLPWAMERVARCEPVIWSLCLQILSAGRSVVLEVGLAQAADRDAMRVRIEAAGYACRFHFVDAPVEVRRHRVERRNLERGDTYSFDVTPAMFDFMEARFEPPRPHEHAHTVVESMEVTHG